MTYVTRSLCFLFLLLCCTLPVAARWQPLARDITMYDGLPSNVVYDVIEDSKGFIWFCTDQGVSRYAWPGRYHPDE